MRTIKLKIIAIDINNDEKEIDDLYYFEEYGHRSLTEPNGYDMVKEFQIEINGERFRLK